MEAFDYARPETVDQTVALLGQGDAAVLAGGTDLISLMKDGVVAPKRVVAVRSIAELGRIGEAGDELAIGATVTLAELAAHPVVAQRLPALGQAVAGIASPQIRAMGTVGGDLLQRPRCWYYRSGFGLLARRDDRSMVVDGDNRYHSIFGDGPAHFVNPSSLAPALIALGARATIVGKEGTREVSVAELYRAPRDETERELTVETSELLTTIHVRLEPGTACATYEVRQRRSLDWPLAAASVAVRRTGTTGAVEAATIVLGHVAPTPWLSAAAARALEGRSLDATSAREAATAAVDEAKPLSGNEYKVQLARVAVERALLRAVG